MQKEETKRRILEAAVGLFESKGFYETTVANIAKAAKVSPGSIYAHFGSPGNILAYSHRVVLEQRAQRVRDIRESWPENRSVLELMEANLQELWGMSEEVRIDNISAYQSWCWVCDPEDYIAPDDMYAGLISEMLDVAMMAKRRGEISPDIDVPVIIDLLTPFFFHCLQQGRLSEEAYQAQYQTFMTRFWYLFGVNDRKIRDVA